MARFSWIVVDVHLTHFVMTVEDDGRPACCSSSSRIAIATNVSESNVSTSTRINVSIKNARKNRNYQMICFETRFSFNLMSSLFISFKITSQKMAF